MAALRYEASDNGEVWRSADDDVLGYASPFRMTWEASRATKRGVVDGGIALPFEPASFRDFMLFRDHYIGAARGYVARFRPGVARAAALYERMTGKVFPAFRPPALWDAEPIYYMSNARTFVPSGTPVRFPRYSKALDWELELGFVLKTPLYNATPEQAEAAIGAFVVLNDFSARDVQIAEQSSGFGPQKAKHFLSSLSATAALAEDILPRWQTLAARVELNGTIVSRPSSAAPRWSLGEMLAHASNSERLLPGELFGTGTLVGGSGMECQTWLKIGDRLRLAIDGVGVIDHRVVADDAGEDSA